MQFITSWDDGSSLDSKIVDLLLKYELPGIFYIPSVCELLPIDILRIDELGFEIGGHTTSHPENLRLLETSIQYDEIKMNKEWLENIIGHSINSFCYPSGRFDDFTIKEVQRAGFTEARSTLVLNTDEPIDLFKIKTSIHVFGRREYKGIPWYDIAKSVFDLAKAKDGYFHIWGHSNEIDFNGEWNNLDRFFKYVRKNL
jgi:peptidoglycan-N-acetylglucosamine deacetylase